MAQQQQPPTTTTTTTTTTSPKYELLYHPGIPGRGEFIRLALESQKIPYTDIANPSSSSSSSAHENGYATVQRICMNPHALESAAGNPPVFSPPGLRVCFASTGGQGQAEEGNRKTLVISQTPNILIYLGEKIPGLVGGEVKGNGKGKGEDGEGEEDDEEEEEEERGKKKFWIQQLMMTALDLNNEVHDTHHPIAGKKRKYPIPFFSSSPSPFFLFSLFPKKRKRKKKTPAIFHFLCSDFFFFNPID